MEWIELRDGDRPTEWGGIGLDYDVVDGHLKGVTLGHGSDLLRLSFEPYSAMKVLKPKPPRQEVRWYISGEVHGLTVAEFREYEGEAQNRADELRATTGKHDCVKVEAVDVYLTPQGEIIGLVQDA